MGVACLRLSKAQCKMELGRPGPKKQEKVSFKVPKRKAFPLLLRSLSDLLWCFVFAVLSENKQIRNRKIHYSHGCILHL